MNRSTLIGIGLALALLLVILVATGGSPAPKAVQGPRTLEEAPIQKVAFMTDPSAQKSAPKAEAKPAEGHAAPASH